MTSNWVHHCANAYRKIIDAMSYPGEVYNIALDYGDNPFKGQILDSVLLVAMMLLDGEVSYQIIGNFAQKTSDIIKRMTFSKEVSIECADYVFILNKINNIDINRILSQVKIGDLVDPHKSAMLIIWLDDFKTGDTYTLTGPGLKTEKSITLPNMSDFIRVRNNLVTEYPLGIDMLLIDESGSVMALPRTTMIKESKHGLCCS